MNTMLLGNVQIVQYEQEWNETKNKLQSFTPDKPLLPYVGTLDWENTEKDGGEYATVDEYYYNINTNLGKTMLTLRGRAAFCVRLVKTAPHTLTPIDIHPPLCYPHDV